MADLLDGILDAPDPEPEPGIEVSNEMAHLDAELDDGGTCGWHHRRRGRTGRGTGGTGRGTGGAGGGAGAGRRGPQSRPPSPTRIARIFTSKDVGEEDVGAFSTNDKAVIHRRRRGALGPQEALLEVEHVEARFGRRRWFSGKVEV